MVSARKNRKTPDPILDQYANVVQQNVKQSRVNMGKHLNSHKPQHNQANFVQISH